MPSAPTPVAFWNPLLLWSDFAIRATEMLLSSGQVIGMRVGQMARAGANPSRADRREMLLMGSEKVKAATQSGLAVAAGLQASNLQLAVRAWQQWLASAGAFTALAGSRSVGEAMARQQRLIGALGSSGHSHSHLSSDTARLMSAALDPVHRAATANARRLARVNSRARAR